MRVYVPFGKGNRIEEGMILSITETDSADGLKSILRLIDEVPVLTPAQIQLALFMRDRYFCSTYDAVRTILPIGLLLDKSGQTRIRDKTVEIASLTILPDEAKDFALSKEKRAPMQSRILDELADYGDMPVRELLMFSGASRQSLSALVKAELISLYEIEAFRRPEYHRGVPKEYPVLNEEQLQAYLQLSDLSRELKASCALLQGVTGSGKTSVYIHLISNVLNSGKTAILLVPEIALTPQMIETFSSYFPDQIAILHSSLSTGERYDEWKRIRDGKARLTIGTRSAVFAPCENLGIIIIDEEQEESYRSENSPRYHARDIAKYRCSKDKCLLLLGSATPDVCSRYNAQIGKYQYFRLEKRYNELNLPKVSIVDMKKELRAGNSGSISSYLRKEIALNLEKGEQTILLLNRRGANKLVTCIDCGYLYECPNCSVALTYHSYGNKLMCHYCGYTIKPNADCPSCGGVLDYIGAGTQLVEEELHGLFPETEIIRMDADSVSKINSHEKIIDRFCNEKVPIMIGTQMVAKGLNFENVTLVGVISADQSLYSGDYRSNEKTFSLITQVIGRSGRGTKQGRAVIQTFTPDNETIRQSSTQDYDAFYESEIQMREIQNMPPCCDYLSLTLSGERENEVTAAARYVKNRLEYLMQNKDGRRILGPTPLKVVRVNNRFRYRIHVHCIANKEIRDIISSTITECGKDKRFSNISIYAENEPND